MNIKYIFPLLVLLFLANTGATSEASILDHINPGCPTNSLCSKEFGTKRIAWIKALKDPKSSLKEFKKKNGLPLTFWTKTVKKASFETSYWHGQCFSHQSAAISLMLGQKFSKNFNALKLKEIEYLPKVLVQTNKKVLSFTTIPFDSPVAIKSNALIYNRESDGIYYSVAIKASGDISASHKILKPKNLPQNIDCPKDLQSKFSSLKFPKGLYQAAFCKALWNVDTKKFQTIIMGWSCN